MDTIMFCVPAYGGQSPKWWSRLNALSFAAEKMGLDYRGVIVESTAVVDHNRNKICKTVLENDPDWTFWIDHDTIPPSIALNRLIGVGKPIVSGLYCGKKHPYRPIAYYKREDGLYQNLDTFDRGEILPVDSVGIGCLLLHTSVLKDYQENFVALQRANGGILAVHKDKIKGKIPEKGKASDGWVRDGVLQERLYRPKKLKYFPFFASEYQRTEDHYFFENLAMLGYKPWLDTSVICTHLGDKEYDFTDFKKQVFYEQMGGNTPPELVRDDGK